MDQSCTPSLRTLSYKDSANGPAAKWTSPRTCAAESRSARRAARVAVARRSGRASLNLSPARARRRRRAGRAARRRRLWRPSTFGCQVGAHADGGVGEPLHAVGQVGKRGGEGGVGPEAGPGPPADVVAVAGDDGAAPGARWPRASSRTSARTRWARWVSGTGGSAPSSTSRTARVSAKLAPGDALVSQRALPPPVGGFDEAALAFPVDPGHLPASPGRAGAAAGLRSAR